MAYLDWTKEKVTYILSTLKNKITDMLVNKKDIIEITQAEYDALPDTKLTDGKVYAIKDGKGGGGGGSIPDNVAYLGGIPETIMPIPRNNEYSTEETIIGTWIDGKPIYRKVIQCKSPSSTDREYEIYNIEFINLDMLTNFFGYVQVNDEFNIINWQYGSLRYAETSVHSRVTRKAICMSVGVAPYCNVNSVFVLEYTKITD